MEVNVPIYGSRQFDNVYGIAILHKPENDVAVADDGKKHTGVGLLQSCQYLTGDDQTDFIESATSSTQVEMHCSNFSTPSSCMTHMNRTSDEDDYRQRIRRPSKLCLSIN